MRTIRELDPAAVILLPWADPQPPTADDLAELRPAVVNMPHLIVGRALVDAVHALGASRLDPEVAAVTLGAAVKYREDAARVRVALDRMLTR